MSARSHPTTRFLVESCLLLNLVMQATAALAGIIVEPNVHWIGPEAECDYPSIQEALDDIFDCGIFLCPPGINELRLSANYNHSGQVLVRRTFDIRGGYPSCQATFNGVNKTLSAATPGIPLFVIRPGSGTIRNVLRDLTLFGSSTQAPAGGVVNMEAGNATLTLQDSVVTQGHAASGGGVAMAGDGNRLEIADSDIAQNEAIEGGGIFCTNGGVIDFQSGEIRDNTAELSGGGLYLQGTCKLYGKTAGIDRQILRNTVSDSQQGRGAGVFATYSTIEMGALNSRTRIEQNEVSTEPRHNYTDAGDNRGGGVHLEFADASFYNSWFRGNEAADGGAISAAGGSALLVDRYSGPCDGSDAGNSPDCSLFEFNRALGGEDGEGDEGGDGAVFFGSESFGILPQVVIRRTAIRFNAASCPEAGSPTGGECDLDLAFPGFNSSSSSIVSHSGEQPDTALVGNLIYGNSIGDDADNLGLGIVKDGVYYRGVSVFNENTMAANEDADRVFRDQEGEVSTHLDEIINNVIWDFSPDRAVDEFDPVSIDISSCSVTNFADQFDDEAGSIPVVSNNADPLFRNPDLTTSPNEDFRLQLPDSPAIDRCDDEGGRLTLTYDIVGNPRPINIGGISNGSGQRDAGAFETLPAGALNTTTDLRVDVRSTAPKQAELFAPHDFTIDVGNVGRNSPSVFRVALDFSPASATLESLTGATDPVTAEPRWDCDLAAARCDSLSGLAPGGTTLPITAVFSYASPGLKAVTATVEMQDNALTELNPDNSVSSDTVTVGTGADLELRFVSASPRVVAVNEAHFLFVSVGNSGPGMVVGTRVQLDADGGAIESFEALGWVCNTTTGICALSTALQAGATAPVITAGIRHDQAGPKALSGTVSATDGTGDPNPDNDSGMDLVEVFLPAEELFADGFES